MRLFDRRGVVLTVGLRVRTRDGYGLIVELDPDGYALVLLDGTTLATAYPTDQVGVQFRIRPPLTLA